MEKRTILVADDSLGIRNVMKMFLENKGFRVLLACDSEHAKSILADNNHSVDAVITDQHMGNTNGFELIAWVRHELPGVPVLMMSGDDIEGRNPQPDEIINKPISDFNHQILLPLQEQLTLSLAACA